jgi:potassium/chloride transporter 4/5/6
VTFGVGSLIQTAGLGGLAPNTVMVGWSRHWRESPDTKPLQMVRLIMQAHAYNMALIVCKGFEHVPDSATSLTRPIDIWWVVHDGGLQLLLTTILRKAKVWSHAPLRVFCVIQADEDPEDLHGKVVDFL